MWIKSGKEFSTPFTSDDPTKTSKGDAIICALGRYRKSGVDFGMLWPARATSTTVSMVRSQNSTPRGVLYARHSDELRQNTVERPAGVGTCD
jgi:hypothetical protein